MGSVIFGAGSSVPITLIYCPGLSPGMVFIILVRFGHFSSAAVWIAFIDVFYRIIREESGSGGWNDGSAQSKEAYLAEKERNKCERKTAAQTAGFFL